MPGKASPRDNVVFEAGLFGGVLGMRRTFILHASGAKLPSDLLGLTRIRYGEEMTAAEMRGVNQKLRKAIESEGRIVGIEGMWWQFSLTERSAEEPSAVSLLRISRDRDGMLELTGRSWQADGTLSARYRSEAAREKKDPAGHLLLLEGRTASAPERAAVGRDGRDQNSSLRIARPVTGQLVRTLPERQRTDVGDLPARRSRGPEHPGRTRRSEARRVDRGASAALQALRNA